MGESLSKLLAEIIYGFIVEVRNECLANGVDKMYFLSRDGCYFFEVNQWIDSHQLKDKNLSLESSLLHVSRKQFLFVDVSAENIPAVVSNYFDHKNIDQETVRNMVSFLEIDQDVELGAECDVLLSKEVITQNISLNLPLKSAVSKRVDEINTASIRYLEQEGVLTSRSVAFIDVGYKASFGQRLQKFLLNRSSDNEIRKIYYFQLLDTLRSKDSLLETCTFGSINKLKLKPLLNLNYSWLEIFVKDLSLGQLLGYKREVGKVVPVRDVMKVPNKFFLPLPTGSIYSEPSVERCDQLARIFVQKMYRPISEDLEEIRAMTHDSELKERMTIVKKVGFGDIFRPGKFKKLILEDYWLTGSLVYSNRGWLIPILNWVFKIYFFSKSIFQKSRVSRDQGVVVK